ncbi:multidrug resistance protein 1 [Elysia marginata]|uniref:Multidrug resistance protein 1 n=1 Tax=Elysia marginata TaxID=1093978 RepID=A0AAV4GZ34_9GAST|nr:multidrug resistance protein 1 [Elysia marginata]
MLAAYQNATQGNITCENLESTKNLFDEMDDKVLIYLVGSLVVMISAFGQVYLFIVSAERQIIRMRLAFYKAIVRQEMGWLDSKSPGELAVKLTEYVANLSEAKKYGINKSLVLGIGWGVSWCAMFFNWAVGFWYGGKLVRDGDYSVKDMMSVFLQALLGVLALGLAAPSAIIVNTGRAAAFSVFEILDRKSKIDSLSVEGLKPPSLTGNLRLRDVHFTYPCRENVKILQGLDLSVKAGQTVALVGASGCGKSTVIQLLLRFYDPDQGQVSTKRLTDHEAK